MQRRMVSRVKELTSLETGQCWSRPRVSQPTLLFPEFHLGACRGLLGEGGQLLIPPYTAVTNKNETNEVHIQLPKLEKTESS